MKRRGRARKRPLIRFGVFRAFSPARFILYRPLFRLWGYTRFLRAFPLAIPHLFVRLFRSPNFTFSPSVFKSFAKHRQENTEDFASFDDKT